MRPTNVTFPTLLGGKKRHETIKHQRRQHWAAKKKGNTG
jgi:hypothetical protein